MTTSEIANIVGIHPNTVRLYEELQLISKPKRKHNGYRVFTELHVLQFKVARLAFEVEVLQNGLRKQAVNIIKACAKCDFDKALQLTFNYLLKIDKEKKNAENAIQIVEQIIAGKIQDCNLCLTIKQTANYLNITVDTLRNWELNGLIKIKRKNNGYRIYTNEDIQILTIIKSLRCANYSLSAILRMLNIISNNPQANIREAIENSKSDDIITACDNLLTSLDHAKQNAKKICTLLLELKKINPPF